MLAHLTGGESGYATLTAVLVLLILGALIITPLLVFMNSGLQAGQTHERRTDELYAADAGVDYAVWHLRSGGIEVPQGGLVELPEFAINDKTVEVTIEDVTPPGEEDVLNYKITSTATSDSGSSTTVESYVSKLPFAGLLNNAITSAGNVTIRPGSVVNGDVQYGGTLDNKGTINGEITDNLDDISWPTADVFSDFYKSCLKDEGVDPNNPAQWFPYDTVDLKTWPDTLGPLYRVGDLTIKNTDPNPQSVTLAGTIYVTGNLVVQQNCTIILEQQVEGETICHNIFAEGTIQINPGSIIEGSGCIVAVGNLDFQPNIPTGSDDFIFLMSIGGTTKLQPGNNFYGSVAGNVDVYLQPNVSLNWWDGGGGLDFPGGGGLEISTYTIQQH